MDMTPATVNLTRPSEVSALLKELQFKPSKVLGQNFLIDANILQIIMRMADVQPDETVLEVGPGLGALTEELLKSAARVVSVEKDSRLFAYLSQRFAGCRKLELIHADILDAYPLAFTPARIVANLPYSIASRFIFSVMERGDGPARLVVTIQKEVADRLAASPATADYGLLSVMTQLGYEVTSRREIKPTCFLPAPEVTSAIVELNRRPQPLAVAAELPRLRDLLKLAFGHRRKQLASILSHAGYARAQVETLLVRSGLPALARPEELDPAAWVQFARQLASA